MPIRFINFFKVKHRVVSKIRRDVYFGYDYKCKCGDEWFETDESLLRRWDNASPVKESFRFRPDIPRLL
jgi:hypothetical protein